jgi:RNA polymerase sigma factor (sigma-70 family)
MLLTNEELVALIHAGTDVTENMSQLYQQNIPLIEQFIYPYMKATGSSTVLEKQDLMQEAYFGLVKAVANYKPSEEAKFMTYAEYHIKQAVRRHKQNFENIKRIPVHQLELISKYQDFTHKFQLEQGYEPIQNEIMEALNIKKPKLDLLERIIQEMNCTSIDAVIPGTEGVTYSDAVADDYDLEEDVTDELAYEYHKNAIWEAVDELPEAQRDIIISRFKNSLTFESIAKSEGLSIERIRQIQVMALRALKKKKQIKEAALQYCYECYQAYHFGVQRCKDTRSSSVEWVVFKRLEMEERMKKITDEIDALNSFKNILEGVIQ